MKPFVPVAVVGGGRHAVALADHAAPFRRFRVARWVPVGDGAEGGRAAALADRLGVPFSNDWAGTVRDASLPAVLVLSEDTRRQGVVVEALAAGKAVLCPGPIASAPAEVAECTAALRRSRGALLAPGELRYAPGVRTALESIAAGEAGTLHSIYVAARAAPPKHAHPSETVADRLGWDVFDAVLAADKSPLARIQAHAGRLFGGGSGADTAVVIARFESGLIATVELSECLPLAVPAAPAEIEIEIVGSRRAIHLEPFHTAVRVYGGSTVSLHPWVDPPVLAMVDDLLDILDEQSAQPGGAAIQQVTDVMRAVDQAIRGGVLS